MMAHTHCEGTQSYCGGHTEISWTHTNYSECKQSHFGENTQSIKRAHSVSESHTESLWWPRGSFWGHRSQCDDTQKNGKGMQCHCEGQRESVWRAYKSHCEVTQSHSEGAQVSIKSHGESLGMHRDILRSNKVIFRIIQSCECHTESMWR